MFWFKRKREEKRRRLEEEQRIKREQEAERLRREEEARQRAAQQRKIAEERKLQIEKEKLQIEEAGKKLQKTGSVEIDSEAVTLTDYSLLHCNIICEAGEYMGAVIPMAPDEFMMVGRDPATANIVLSGSGVSSFHCQLRYDVDRGCFQVVDFSTYGTYVNGYKLEKNVLTNCSSESVIQIANSGNRFRLHVERSL